MTNYFADLFEIIKDAIAYTLDQMRTGLIHMLGGYTPDECVVHPDKVEHICVGREYSLQDICSQRFEYSVAKCQEELMTKLIPYVRQYVNFEAFNCPATDEYVTRAHLRVVNLKEDK